MKKKYSMAILASFFLSSFIIPTKAEIQKVTLLVSGLACPFCAYGLEKHTKKIKGVDTYTFDINTGKASITLKESASIRHNAFKKAVTKAGFTPEEINIQARGTIKESEDGIILVVSNSNEKFLLHEKETSPSLSKALEKKLLAIKAQEKEIIIEGAVHEHKGLPPALLIVSWELAK